MGALQQCIPHVLLIHHQQSPAMKKINTFVDEFFMIVFKILGYTIVIGLILMLGFGPLIMALFTKQ